MDRTLSRIPVPTGFIYAEDLDYEVVREDWSKYKLEDGTILKARIVAAKISRGLEEDQKTIRYTDDGEPWYNIRYNVVIVAEVPEELLRKQ